MLRGNLQLPIQIHVDVESVSSPITDYTILMYYGMCFININSTCYSCPSFSPICINVARVVEKCIASHNLEEDY